jgi:hypothetical protein
LRYIARNISTFCSLMHALPGPGTSEPVGTTLIIAKYPFDYFADTGHAQYAPLASRIPASISP